MSDTGGLRAFVHRYMTPENRLAEIMCGLVMVLSFTTTTNAAFTDITPRQLLIAVLGCNTAWGIVDGVTYILGNMLLRSHANQALVRLQQASQPDDIKQSIDALIGSEVHEFIEPSHRQQMQSWIQQGAAKVKPQPVGMTREDVYTAIACFIIVFVSTFPLAVPFMLMSDKTLALRVSNYLALGMLFVMGYRWASGVGASRWHVGFTMLLLGAVLVVITVLLGG
jgi:VIT1/CCC1 family predicted Fe2+/Mn2+ transporter